MQILPVPVQLIKSQPHFGSQHPIKPQASLHTPHPQLSHMGANHGSACSLLTQSTAPVAHYIKHPTLMPPSNQNHCDYCLAER